MYAESRVSSMTPVEPNGPLDQQNSKGEQGAAESGPALEVIQLANGETVWSVSMRPDFCNCRPNAISGLLLTVSGMPMTNLSTTVVPVLHQSIPETMVVQFLRGITVVLGQEAVPLRSPLRRNLSKGDVPRQRCALT